MKPEKLQHKWVHTIPAFLSYASCSECGRVNNKNNIGKECKPMLKISDLRDSDILKLTPINSGDKNDTEKLSNNNR